MTKAETLAALKNQMDSFYSLEQVIKIIEGIEPAPASGVLTQSLADKIHSEIERSLDYNGSDLVNKDTAEFEFGYNGREVNLCDVEINVDAIMLHVDGVLEQFIEEEDETAGEE